MIFPLKDVNNMVLFFESFPLLLRADIFMCMSKCRIQWLLLNLVSSTFVSVQGLAQLEILCKQLYETTDTAVRHQAEKALVEFTNSPDCLSKCQLLLERGSVSNLSNTCNTRKGTDNI